MECVREARCETQVTTVGLSNLQIIKNYKKEAFKYVNLVYVFREKKFAQIRLI